MIYMTVYCSDVNLLFNVLKENKVNRPMSSSGDTTEQLLPN